MNKVQYDIFILDNKLPVAIISLFATIALITTGAVLNSLWLYVTALIRNCVSRVVNKLIVRFKDLAEEQTSN